MLCCAVYLKKFEEDSLIKRRQFHFDLQEHVIGLSQERKSWLSTLSLATLFEASVTPRISKNIQSHARPIRVIFRNQEQVAMFIQLESNIPPDTARAAALNRLSGVHNAMYN